MSSTSRTRCSRQADGQAVQERHVRGLADARGVRDRGRHKGGVPQRRQRDEHDRIGKRVAQACRDLHRQARLADAARPGQRQQADLWLPQQIGDRA